MIKRTYMIRCNPTGYVFRTRSFLLISCIDRLKEVFPDLRKPPLESKSALDKQTTFYNGISASAFPSLTIVPESPPIRSPPHLAASPCTPSRLHSHTDNRLP